MGSSWPVRSRSFVVISSVVALAYVAFAELGFSLAFSLKQVTAVWPPIGIAVAALLLGGFRSIPGVFAGAWIANWLTGEPPWTAAAIAVGNVAGPVAAVWLLRRFARFDGALERARDVLALVVMAVVAATITSANGTAQLALAGLVHASNFAAVWSLWWAGDCIGVVLFSPLILTLKSSHRYSRAQLLELSVLTIALLGTSWLAFISPYPLRLSVYPLVVWAALRFRQRETAFAVAIVSAIAIWGAAHQVGSLGTGSLDLRLTGVLTFMAILALTGLLMGAVTAERRAANERLREADSQLKRALEATTRVAETLQAAFLPEALPKRDGLQSDALYLAAGDEMLIGGDWYDAFELPDRRLVVSIGDVVGHGLNAAVAAARIRQGIYVSAFDTGDPGAILEKTNRTLHVHDGVMATALVAIFDADLRAMRYAAAGHPPPVHGHPSKAAAELSTGGTPLGAGVPVAAQTHEEPLAPGSVLVFYTDGLVEFARDAPAAERSMLEAVRRLAQEPEIAEPARYLQQAVMGAARPRDDVAIVIVRVGARSPEQYRPARPMP